MDANETAPDLEVDLGADDAEPGRDAVSGQVDPRCRCGDDFGAVRCELDIELHFGRGVANGQLACYRESGWAATDGVAMERNHRVLSDVQEIGRAQMPVSQPDTGRDASGMKFQQHRGRSILAPGQ